jgi:hypothetical protein
MWIDVALVALVVSAPDSIEQGRFLEPCSTRLQTGEQLENLKLERALDSTR